MTSQSDIRPKSASEPRPARVAVQAVSKAYGPVQALAGVTFDIRGGEVLGLLGPNGAGKTTTVESVAGLLTPDAGAIEICGLDPRRHPHAVKRMMGVALQSTGLPDGITPREAVAAYAALYGSRVDPLALLARFGLEAKAAVRVGALSGGQKQRLALALAFVNDPPVIILDEPTVGLDPQMRRELHELIRQMKVEGRAILLTTHDMDEAAQLCDRVAVLSDGRIIAEGSPGALIEGSKAAMRVRVRTAREPSASWFSPAELFGGLSCDAQGLTFTTTQLQPAIAALFATLGAHGVSVTALQADAGTLEDVILQLVARSAPQVRP